MQHLKLIVTQTFTLLAMVFWAVGSDAVDPRVAVVSGGMAVIFLLLPHALEFTKRR